MSNSPWGPIQHSKTFVWGIREVNTASHGGILATEKAAKKYLSKSALSRGFMWGKYLCFEEDCDAQIVLRELIDKGFLSVSEEENAAINRTLEIYHADYLKERRK